MDDPLVLESLLAVRAWERKAAVLKNGVHENSVVDSPASGVMEVTGQVIGMETLPPAVTDSLVGDDTSKPGDGAQCEAAQVEEIALTSKPSEAGIASEVPFESSSLLLPNSEIFNDNAVEGTAVAQKNPRKRRQNWAKEETDHLLRAVLNTNKASTRMKQGPARVSYWDAIAKEVPGTTGHECRRRMDTLKKSFRTTKNYYDGHRKEFKQLNEKDLEEMNVSTRLTEEWCNQIRNNCPPKSKKKSKTNGAGSSSKSSGFASNSSTLGFQPPDLPDRIDQSEPTLVWKLEYGVGIQQRELVCTPCQGSSPSCDCNLNHTQYSSESDFDKADIGIKSDRELHYIKLRLTLCLTSEEYKRGAGVSSGRATIVS